MSSNTKRRNHYAARQINPKPGVVFTLILSYPYVSNSMKSFPRSSAHDVMLAVALTLLWGTIYFWDPIGRKWPKFRFSVEVLFGLIALSGMATLYGTIIYLILKN